MRALEAFRHLRAGRAYRYPLCCVLTYALGHLLGAKAGASRRGVIDLGAYRYVPCRWHQHGPNWRPRRTGATSGIHRNGTGGVGPVPGLESFHHTNPLS